MSGYRSLFGALLLTLCLLRASAQHAATPVEGSGCVKAGVEHCLVLIDTETKVHYQLVFHGNGKRPLPGTGIHFSGTAPRNRMSTCRQGIIVDVEEWTPVKMECPAGK
jgi:hypothetical protein